MWCLGRLLPLMIGDKISEGDPYWNNYLLLLTIMDYVFAPTLSADTSAYLKEIINDHHKAYKQLYPHKSILPKMHYMIHLPECIEK